jgi:hypothetical protein
MENAIATIYLSAGLNEKLQAVQARLNPITLDQLHYQRQGPSCVL